MIYCLGRISVYDEYIATDPNPCKLGRVPEEDYPGGSVWKTREEAEQYLRDHGVYGFTEGFAVYGVLADWERDTEPSKGGSYHDLLVSSLLVKL